MTHSHVRTDAQVSALESLLLHGSHTGILACDELRVVRYANPAAHRMVPGLLVGRVPPGPELRPGDQAIGGRLVTASPQPLPGGWTGWHLHDVTGVRERVDGLLTERTRSRFLAGASSRLGLSLHPTRTARTVAELATELADTAVVVLPSGAGTVEWYRHDADGTDSGWLLIRQLPEAVAAALHGYVDALDPLLPGELAVEPWSSTGRPATAAVTALPGSNASAGALVLLRHTAGPYDESETALVGEFGRRAGVALTVAGLYAQQARTAEVLRRSVLEPQLPLVDGMELGAAYIPADAGTMIGGDFYDVHPTPGEGGATLLLGDVSGKGVDAGVCAAQIRQSVRVLRRLEADPLRLLELLNDVLLEVNPTHLEPRFATMVLGSAHPLPGGGLRLQLSGGGHPPPLVLNGSGVAPVEIGGGLVGALRSPRFRSRSVDLAPGDACVIYTDGVVEARGGLGGGQLFGEQRLAELLADCRELPASAIAERVIAHTARWLDDGTHDDIAVLVVQAPPHQRPVETVRRHLYAVPSTAPAPS